MSSGLDIQSVEFGLSEPMHDEFRRKLVEHIKQFQKDFSPELPPHLQETLQDLEESLSVRGVTITDIVDSIFELAVCSNNYSPSKEFSELLSALLQERKDVSNETCLQLLDGSDHAIIRLAQHSPTDVFSKTHISSGVMGTWSETVTKEELSTIRKLVKYPHKIIELIYGMTVNNVPIQSAIASLHETQAKELASIANTYWKWFESVQDKVSGVSILEHIPAKELTKYLNSDAFVHDLETGKKIGADVLRIVS